MLITSHSKSISDFVNSNISDAKNRTIYSHYGGYGPVEQSCNKFASQLEIKEKLTSKDNCTEIEPEHTFGHKSLALSTELFMFSILSLFVKQSYN